ncbi:MAG: 50S ribosomal protein L23 [Patescibacteria group bacterium]
MGILNLKKNKVADEAPKATRKVAVKSVSKKVPAVIGGSTHMIASRVVLRPRVTEKATVLSQFGREVHVFEVSRLATKSTVSKAIQELYKVTPEKVAILKVPPKNSIVRGRMTKGRTDRKAYVYLAKGDKIEAA